MCRSKATYSRPLAPSLFIKELSWEGSYVQISTNFEWIWKPESQFSEVVYWLCIVSKIISPFASSSGLRQRMFRPKSTIPPTFVLLGPT